jgi:glycosyltransferase involved in cell wall biosynthesis
MECGLPIISYDRGGHNDFLTSGKTGFLVEVGNKEAFKRRVNTIIADKELRRRIGAHNRHFIKNFYIDKCADKYLALFEEIKTRSV